MRREGKKHRRPCAPRLSIRAIEAGRRSRVSGYVRNAVVGWSVGVGGAGQLRASFDQPSSWAGSFSLLPLVTPTGGSPDRIGPHVGCCLALTRSGCRQNGDRQDCVVSAAESMVSRSEEVACRNRSPNLIIMSNFSAKFNLTC